MREVLRKLPPSVREALQKNIPPPSEGLTRIRDLHPPGWRGILHPVGWPAYSATCMLEPMGCPYCLATKQFDEIEMEFGQPPSQDNRGRLLQLEGGGQEEANTKLKDQKMPAATDTVNNNNNSWATLAKRVTEKQKRVENNNDTGGDLILFDNGIDEVLNDTAVRRETRDKSGVGQNVVGGIDNKDIAPDDLEKLVKTLEPVLGDYQLRMNNTGAVDNKEKIASCKGKKTGKVEDNTAVKENASVDEMRTEQELSKCFAKSFSESTHLHMIVVKSNKRQYVFSLSDR